jgi:hypothetical protein
MNDKQRRRTATTKTRKRGQRRTALRVDVLRLDFQPEHCLIEDTVEQYLERLRHGEKLQPLTVRFDGKFYWLQDGFHRLEAARRAGLKKIEVDVLPGTLVEMEAEFRLGLARIKKALAEEAAQHPTKAKRGRDGRHDA